MMAEDSASQTLGEASSSCRRCKSQPATVDIRSEPACRDCFCEYVQTKVVKRLESFRVRNAAPGKPRKILVALSFGACSTSLVHILQHNIERQISRTGRAGYDFHVLHVNIYDAGEEVNHRLEALKSSYPKYDFQSATILESSGGSKRRENNSRGNGGAFGGQGGATPTSDQDLLAMMGSVASPAAKSDLLSIALVRSVVAKAHELKCEGIMWGDSTTRLAEKVLAETAKGRGCGLPYLIGDGPSPFGVDFNYPLRDLLRREVATYAAARDLPVFERYDSKSTRTTAISSKSMSIDALMGEYFETVEQAYPSIVTNVVRTSAKLQRPAEINGQLPCGICGLPVEPEQFGLGSWEGNQNNSNQTEREQICYACFRSTESIRASNGG